MFFTLYFLFSYRLKGRTFMTKLLEHEYLEQFEILKEKYKSQEFIAFTADTWSSQNQAKHFVR